MASESLRRLVLGALAELPLDASVDEFITRLHLREEDPATGGQDIRREDSERNEHTPGRGVP